eukprot:gene7556-biopygen4557
MGPEVGPALQRRSRDTPFFLLGVRLAETAARARKRAVGGNGFCGRTLRIGVTESGSARCDVGGDPGRGGKNSTTSTLARDVVREMLHDSGGICGICTCSSCHSIRRSCCLEMWGGGVFQFAICSTIPRRNFVHPPNSPPDRKLRRKKCLDSFYWRPGQPHGAPPPKAR